MAGLTLDAGALIAYERGDALATSDADDMRKLLGPRFTILAV